jgi:hypothetical protein
MRLLRFTLAALVAAVVFVPSALAAERVKPNIHFFSGAQDDAHWTPKDSSDANRMAIELEVGPFATGGVGYAGLEFNHEEGRPAPAVEPYFWHREDRATASGQTGGSPRLVIFFEDGRLELRPDEWSTEWRQVGGEDEHGEKGNWDATGGNCVFLYDVEYEDARECFEGRLVTNVHLVTDSNWMPDKMSGYTNWVDQIQYEGFVYSHASDNNNSQRPAASTSLLP